MNLKGLQIIQELHHNVYSDPHEREVWMNFKSLGFNHKLSHIIYAILQAMVVLTPMVHRVKFYKISHM